MTWAKICGICHPDDLALCVEAGADALGFVVDYPVEVPWNLTVERARELMALVPAGVERVAVVGDDPDQVLSIVEALHPDLVQLHADEDPATTARLVEGLHALGVRVAKALRFDVDSGALLTRHDVPDTPVATARLYAELGVDVLLVDSVSRDRPAGTGRMVDFRMARTIRDGEIPPVSVRVWAILGLAEGLPCTGWCPDSGRECHGRRTACRVPPVQQDRVHQLPAEPLVLEGRLRNAAFYYRAAEFLTDPSDPDKESLYASFADAFTRGFADEGIERSLVPYGDGFLPILRLPAVGERRGTVVAHGGFDSFIEEFFCFWRYLADRGYDVVAFEGPGQGAAHRVYGLPHDHDWEKPVGAVLDHFGLDDVALLGISFGGYWCVRAAAYEKRVTRLIADPPLYDLVAAAGPAVRRILDIMLKSPRLLNWSIRVRMRAFPMLRHVIRQALFMTNRLDAEPAAAAHWLLGMNEKHLSSERVRCDVLLMAGEKDRFQPVKLFRMQQAALVHARSVTGRVFTRAEQAQNHCQMGNLKLALEYLADWLDGGPPAE